MGAKASKQNKGIAGGDAKQTSEMVSQDSERRQPRLV